MMNDNLNEYQDLIRRMEAAPRVVPPADFTRRVMGRLPEHHAGFWHPLKQIERLFNIGGNGEAKVSQAACSFYYFMTSFFYLIIGIVSMTGFKNNSPGPEAMDWIGLQPYFAVGTAIWLFALGFLLMIGGRRGVQAARFGTMFYIFSAVANSIWLRPYLHIPYAVIFIIGLAATSALMGIVLVRAVQKMELRAV